MERLRLAPKTTLMAAAPMLALAMVALLALWSSVSNPADAAQDASRMLPWIATMAMLGMAGGALASFWGLRSIKRSMLPVFDAVHAIREGDLDTAFTTSSRDEFGDLVEGMDQMRLTLQRRAEADRAIVAENLRVRRALDNVSAPVTVSDSDNRLIYMNQAASSLLEGMEAQWRKEMPQFNVQALIGKSLADFFVDPEFRRAYSQRLDRERTIEGSVAGRNLRLLASPVIDENGDYQGRVTQWFDTTAELNAQRETEARLAEERRVAAENQRIRIALDHASASVMLADRERNIIYLNKAAATLFTEAEHDFQRDLPGFDAASLLGSSIDGFHKNPHHQADILDRLNESHEAEIEVAGRTLRIIANPVIGENGERLGTAVEWLDRTDEVAVEHEIGELVKAARQGDLDRRLSIDGKSGFFYQLGSGLNALLDELSGVFDEIARVMHRLSEGDLTAKISHDYEGKFARVRDDINETSQQLGDIIGRLDGIAQEVNTASGEISSGNTSLSSRTEQQASSLQQTAASVEQLAATVRNNAENAQQANQVASAARGAAEQGGEVVTKAVDAMEEINDSSSRIAEIIGVIDEIAFQTNLLALNASVEAARAGEQGRGFAVVATEVRNLASRSASAAKEIKDLIRDSVAKVEAGSALVHDSGEKLAEIVGGVKKVGDIVAEIAAASAEQATGIDQVNAAVNSMDEITQQNAALAEQTSAASAAMNENAREMRALMDFFHGGAKSLMPPAASKVALVGNAAGQPSPEHAIKPPLSRPSTLERAATVPAAKPEVVARPSPGTAKVPEPSFDEDEWEEF